MAQVGSIAGRVCLSLAQMKQFAIEQFAKRDVVEGKLSQYLRAVRVT